jgi:hypothetical protein
MGQRKLASWYRHGSVLIALWALLALCALATAGAAEAADSPQWAVTVVPTPSRIEPESPRTEIDRLTVDATGGTYILRSNFGPDWMETAPLAYNASASEVEEAMDNAFTGLTGATVTVTGGPGGGSPYTITWGGSSSQKVLAFPGPEDVRANSAELTGGTHTATLSTVTRGVDAPHLIIMATNVGDHPTDGSTITLDDALPPGVSATAVSGTALYRPGSAMECSTSPVVSCKHEAPVDTGDILYMTVTLTVGSEVPIGFDNKVTVTGGGVESTADVTTSLPIGLGDDTFGPVPRSVFAATSTMQAGAHPDLTTAFALTTADTNRGVATAKDVSFDLPVGLVGNAVGLARCSMQAVVEGTQGKKSCPADSLVGMATVSLNGAGGVFPVVTPVFNIAPAPGEPLAFGFDALAVPVRLDTGVLSNGDYGVRVTTNDINETAVMTATNITIWGVPADHNGPGEDTSFFLGGSTFGGPSDKTRVPLLTNPQQCSVPLTASMRVDPWVEQGHYVRSETQTLGTLTGCDQLRIGASFSMVPDTLEAGAPAGYRFDLTVPQDNAPSGIATPNVKAVSLKLPVGTVVNPSAAWGLKACSNTQFYGPDHPSQEPAGLEQCPREAQVGTLQIKTPALEEQFEGQVFLAEPECDPCTPADAEGGKMVRLFVQAISEGEGGIVVKLEGRVHIDQATGQITTVFDDNPQLPFDEFKLKLAGGPRAVLANPRACGQATSNLDLTPWSTPTTPDVNPSYTFEISQNCFGPQFNPSFVAGTTNIQAGAYSPFTMSFGRPDQDQYLNGLSLTMPPGLLGNIGSVPLCKEPQAAQGTCGVDSLIGHVQALTGPGANPFLVSGGQVFLTEGYNGAPYGLSIVVPAVAGPYTLSGSTGRGTVVVRAKIQVDPIDAHLTVSADPLPTVLDGIPLQLKAVNVTIDKPSFTFNGTSCAKASIGAALSSTGGMSSNASRSFQVTNCAGLSFKPQLKASSSGRTSRSKGASLDVKLTYPKAAWGSQANIRSVKVDLPKQLPSRLTTLQKACPAETFEANPAACSPGSRVGTATATTPILPVALTGPAYFVSYGGAKFPELVVVLSGYGVTVQLHGETFISKAGITSSTFRHVPDVPIGTFELKLPQGPNSSLAANGNLCRSKLKMPTAFTAQNGMTIHRSTPISVTGCAKHKAKKKKGKAGPRNRHRKG